MTEIRKACDKVLGGCQGPDSFFKHPKTRQVFAVLEKISLVALAVFAAYISPKLFFPCFGAGILLGTYLHWSQAKHHHSHAHDEGGGCSQGFLEQLTGVKLPAPLALGINIGITACHIEHHPIIFGPVIGLNAGIWVGKMIGEASSCLSEYFISYLTPSYLSSC